MAEAHFTFLSVQQAAPGAFQVLNDCDDVCHDAELLLLLTPRECHTLFCAEGLPASHPRPQKPRNLRKAAPSPNLARGMPQLSSVPASSSALLRDGQCSLGRAHGLCTHPGMGGHGHSYTSLGVREKGKGPKVLFTKDEVFIQGQLPWMPPSGLSGKYSFPKPLHKGAELRGGASYFWQSLLCPCRLPTLCPSLDLYCIKRPRSSMLLWDAILIG